MIGTRADVIVSFRDAEEPRALAARMIAVAHRHPRGWTVSTSDGSLIETITFDAAASAVLATMGVRHLLMVWTGPGGEVR